MRNTWLSWLSRVSCRGGSARNGEQSFILRRRAPTADADACEAGLEIAGWAVLALRAETGRLPRPSVAIERRARSSLEPQQPQSHTLVSRARARGIDTA